MTAHVFHQTRFSHDPELDGSALPILADNCHRCSEHAQHPRQSLDPQHIAALEALRSTDGPYHSDADRRAVLHLDEGMGVPW